MSRSKKVPLPRTHNLWDGIKFPSTLSGVSKEEESAMKLSDKVTEMLDTGGVIELRGADGKLHPVIIKGLE